jgi:hypothetical protein
MGLSVRVLSQLRRSRDNHWLFGVEGRGGLESLYPKIHIALKISQIPEAIYFPTAHKMSQSFAWLIGPRLKKTHERGHPRTEIGTVEHARENIYPCTQSVSFV